MHKEEAIKIINQALDVATLKGVYSLADVAIIIKALEKINELVEIVPSEE